MPFGGNSDLFIDNEESAMLAMEAPSFSLDTCFPSLDLEPDNMDLLDKHMKFDDVDFASSSTSDESIRVEDDMELIVEEEYMPQAPPELTIQIPQTFAISGAKTDTSTILSAGAPIMSVEDLEGGSGTKHRILKPKDDVTASTVLIQDGDNYVLLDSPPFTNNSSAGSSPPSSPGDSSTDNVRPFVTIVPKPPSPLVATAVSQPSILSMKNESSSDGANNQTIILTPNQLNALALQGSVQIEVVKKEPVTAPMTPLMAPASPPRPLDPCTKNSMQTKALKRHLRMIKNRESASKSRIKKREYVTQLEMENLELKKENEILKQKNMELTKRLLELEVTSQDDVEVLGMKRHSVSRSWSPIFDKVGKSNQAVMLLGCLFLMINLAPLSTLLLGGARGGTEVERLVIAPKQLQPPVGVRGRSLLWVKEDDAEATNTGNSSSGCSFLSINQSESQRLENELRGWMVQMANASVPDFSPRRDYTVNGFLSHQVKEKKIGKRSKHRQGANSKKRTRASKITELNIYGKHKQRAGGVLDGDIHRREDTFYVVAFSGEQLLLPATNHNDSARPKMSLVLPTNHSLPLPSGKIAMVQIDCEVLNTKLVHIKESALPIHHRPKEPFKEAKNMSSPLQPPEVMAGKWPNGKKPAMPNLIDVLKKRK